MPLKEESRAALGVRIRFRFWLHQLCGLGQPLLLTSLYPDFLNPQVERHYTHFAGLPLKSTRYYVGALAHRSPSDSYCVRFDLTKRGGEGV